MRRTVEGLDMPEEVYGQRALARRVGPARSPRSHAGVVTSGMDEHGQVMVLIGGFEQRPATLGVGVRSVAVGDRVSVVKDGGRWVVAGAWTPRGASTVPATSTTPITGTPENPGTVDAMRVRLNSLLLTVDALRSQMVTDNIVREDP